MKKQAIILCIIFFSITESFAGITYYFSAAGNNSNSGTSSASPWLTLSKLTGLALKPGDQILLRRGDTFAGGITLLQSGTSSSPIVIDAYGTGAKPIITGFSTVSAWTNLGGGIYETTSAASTLATCNMVLRNGAVQQIGRYPNANAANKGYLAYQSHSGQTSITSSGISGIPSFVGGELVIRPIQHIMDRCTITAQTSTTISYNAASSYTPIDNYGFFFQDHPGTLDQLGEWYYDKSTKKLRMYWGATAPGSVQVSTVDVLINVTSRSYITLNNLNLTGANLMGMYLSSGRNITVNYCDLSYMGEDGMEGANALNLKVTNSTVNWALNNGIKFGQSANNVTSNHTIKNCTITNIQMLAGMGKSGDVKGMGIAMYGSNSLVEGNVLRNIGYCPIYFVWGNNLVIKNNVIDSFCRTKNDGAAIYTWNNGTAALNYTGQRVTGNIITNTVGAFEGTLSTSRAGYGVFLDINSNGIEIDNNTCYNVERGLFNLGGWNCEVHHNTFYANGTDAIDIYYGSTAWPHQITNFNVKHNILFAKTATQLVARFRSVLSTFSGMGKFDSNYYCRPILEPNGITSSSNTVGGVVYGSNTAGTKYYSLDAWKTIYTLNETNSGKTAKTISDTNNIRFEYNANSSSKTISFGGSYIGVDSTVYSGSITLAPYTSIILLPTSAQISAPTVSITSPLANATFDAPAGITISATAADSDGTVSKVEFYNGTTLLGSDISSPYSFSWGNVAAGSYTLTAKATDNSGASTISSPVAVVVNTLNIAPTASITSPAANAAFDAPAGITISASATDSDGSISKVEFYNGTALLGSDISSPYSFSWGNVAAGSYTLTAKATDNSGATTTSTPITIQASTIVDFAFISFSGQKANSNINLFWTTNNPGTTYAFKVQRSQKRSSFKDIGNTTVINSSAPSLDYSFIDTAPLTGKNYYRIIEVGTNGQLVLSSVILVNYSPAASIANSATSGIEQEAIDRNLELANIKIGPNPASSTLSIFIQGIQKNKELKISILSINGSLLKVVNSNSSNSIIQVDISAFTAGTYLVEVLAGDKKVYKQFVKQ